MLSPARWLSFTKTISDSEDDEVKGLDITAHGEEAYARGEGSILVPPEAALVPEPLPAFTPQVASR